MITFLSGGTGTPKLLRGVQKVMDRHEISVIVNTAEDIWISGNHMSPDVDTVMYLFAGVLNTDTWWGMRNDTFTTHDEILHMGLGEYIAIGDRDRAVHIARGNMLREGTRLTNATRTLCDRFEAPHKRKQTTGRKNQGLHHRRRGEAGPAQRRQQPGGWRPGRQLRTRR